MHHLDSRYAVRREKIHEDHLPRGLFARIRDVKTVDANRHIVARDPVQGGRIGVTGGSKDADAWDVTQHLTNLPLPFRTKLVRGDHVSDIGSEALLIDRDG